MKDDNISNANAPTRKQLSVSMKEESLILQPPLPVWVSYLQSSNPIPMSDTPPYGLRYVSHESDCWLLWYRIFLITTVTQVVKKFPSFMVPHG
jgi:hypothetical protein